MNAPFNLRQLSQYPRTDAAIAGTVALIQMGELGSPYASILTSDLVSSALAGGGDLNLAAGSSAINFLFDQGAGAVTLSVVQGELQVNPALRTSTLDATFVNAQSVTQAGIPVATQADLASVVAQSVTSFNLRTGDVMLMPEDILRAGGAPIRDAHFGGWITAPSVWDTRANDDTVATANWVHRAIHDAGVSSFNGRTGDIVLTLADMNAAIASAPPGVYPTAPSPVLGDASNRVATTLFVDESLQDLHLTISNEQLALLTSTYAPLNSPQLTGIPTAPTANPGTSTGQLATTSFVMHAVTAGTTGVSSFNTRTGAVVLNTGDITSAGGAVLASPAFSGNPTAPTAAPGTSNTQLATTAFVAAAVTAAGGVTSFNTRTGAVVLTSADVSGTGVLANTPLTGIPTAPTAAPGTSTTQVATTAFVAASAAAGVTSFMSRTGAVTLTAADVSAAGGALNASPVFTGTPTAPTPATADSSTTLATTAFVHAAMTAGGGVATFNGRSGAVTLTAADITGAGGALLAGPAFTGVPTAPTPATADSSTTLATTAFVQAAITAGGGIVGWTGSVTGSISELAATQTFGSRVRVANSTTQANNTFSIINKNNGAIGQFADNSGVNGGSYNYPIFKNNVSGQPSIITCGGSDANRSIQMVPVGTGTVQAPTMAPGTNSTAVATTAFVQAAVAAPVVRSYLAGLTLSTAGSSATFSVAAGVACDSTNAVMMSLASALSKTTAAWAVGTGNGALDTGAIANTTWYHVFLIERTDLTVVDVLVSLSATAPTMPANYTFFRRIGAMKTNASAQWTLFHQLGDLFEWDVGVLDINAGTVSTSTQTNYTLTIPTGLKLRAMFGAFASSGAANITLWGSDPDCGGPANNPILTIPSASGFGGGNTMLVTNTSAQILLRNSAPSNNITALSLWTWGWIDRRGQDA